MANQVISVSTFDRVDVQEDQKTEFKRSIFISPETHTPCAKQMHVIAETLAAFMNAEGGMLYIGVNDGGQPFSEAAVSAAKKPKALAWEGCHYAEVSGWQELVLKVLEKLQEIDASKFDELVGLPLSKKHLVRIAKPKERHPECYATKFGTEGNIRIKKSLGNKVYLWQEDKILRKIITAFGVDVSKFMFVV